MSQRDIEDTHKEIYGAKISQGLVSRITDKILPEVFLSSKIVTLPPKSSHPFLPRCKTVVERVRSDGIIPEQNIIVNVSEQFIFGAI